MQVIITLAILLRARKNGFIGERRSPSRERIVENPFNMDKVIKLGNLIQGNVYYDLRHAIYWPKGCAPAMTAAMGMGGGFVPLLVVIEK